MANPNGLTSTEETDARQTASLDDLLESWSVMDLDSADGHPEGYSAVVNDEEVVAYFLHDADAFRFRLAEINRILNG